MSARTTLICDICMADAASEYGGTSLLLGRVHVCKNCNTGLVNKLVGAVANANIEPCRCNLQAYAYSQQMGSQGGFR